MLTPSELRLDDFAELALFHHTVVAGSHVGVGPLVVPPFEGTELEAQFTIVVDHPSWTQRHERVDDQSPGTVEDPGVLEHVPVEHVEFGFVVVENALEHLTLAGTC